jgi:hypothetical protein
MRTNLKHIIQIVIQKMGFLKLKVREKSAEFLKFLGDQQLIGPHYMISLILEKVDQMLKPLSELDLTPTPARRKSIKSAKEEDDGKEKKKDKSSFNSFIWVSSISLLNHYENKYKITLKDSVIFNKIMNIINIALKHNISTVRIAAESLYVQLFQIHGPKIFKQ